MAVRCGQVRSHVVPDAPEPPNGFVQYPLFAADIHHMIRCGVVLRPEVRYNLPAAAPHRPTRAVNVFFRFVFVLRAPPCSLLLWIRRPAPPQNAACYWHHLLVLWSLPLPWCVLVTFRLAMGPCGQPVCSPLQAREVWLEGVPAVGYAVVGRTYYFGGVEVQGISCGLSSIHVRRCDQLTPCSAGALSVLRRATARAGGQK